tara:strand:- start:367 stop:2610 length:2244 start_codon:yes stop_codon:yes gene_type:complete
MQPSLRTSIVLLACSPVAFGQSDDCGIPDAISGEGEFAYSYATATTDIVIGETEPLCSAFIANDVFWTWTATADGDYLFQLDPESVLGYRFHLYDGSNCLATCIGTGSPAPLDPMRVNGLLAGDDILIRIGAQSVNFGIGQLSILAVPPVPLEDSCATPAAIAGFGAFDFEATRATDSNFNGGSVACQPLPGAQRMHHDVFLAWTATASGDVAFDICNAVTDVTLAVHLGSDCSATCLTGDNREECIGEQSSARIYGVSAGQTYLLQIGTATDPHANSIVHGTVDVSVAPPEVPGNTCSNPVAISGLGSFGWNADDSTDSGFAGAFGDCVEPIEGMLAQDTFFRWTATGSGARRFESNGLLTSEVLRVYEGDDCSATCIDVNFADAYGVTVAGVAPGDEYLIQISAWRRISYGASGQLDVSIPVVETAGDTCAAPIVIPFAAASLGAEIYWDNSLATTSGFDGGSPANCMSPSNPDGSPLGQIHRDRFFLFDGFALAGYTVSTDGSPSIADTRISVHAGNDCNAVCIGSNDDIAPGGGNSASSFTFFTGLPQCQGTEFLIQVGGGGAFDSGIGVLKVVPGPIALSIFNFLCHPASPHHDGESVSLCDSTYGAATPSGLHLEASQGPAGEFGFFLVSGGANSNLPIFNGVLCLDLPLGRFNPQIATNQGLPVLNSVGQFDASGRLQNLSGTAPSSGGSGFDVPLQLPFSPPGQTITPGSTWYFQLWYRDQVLTPGDSANFSHVLGLSF